MKIHPDSPASKSEIKRVATLVGLDKIDYEACYKLIKTGAKRQTANGHADEMVALPKGNFQIVGATDKRTDAYNTVVWLMGSWISGEWFKTSPILKCEKIKGGYSFETENSHYELRKV